MQGPVGFVDLGLGVALGMAIVPLVQAGSGLITFKVPQGMLPTTVARHAAVAGAEPPVPWCDPVSQARATGCSASQRRAATRSTHHRGAGAGESGALVVEAHSKPPIRTSKHTRTCRDSTPMPSGATRPPMRPLSDGLTIFKLTHYPRASRLWAWTKRPSIPIR